MTKPIIGVISKHFFKDYIRPDMYIRDEVKQAVFDNGGIAIGILLPRDEKLKANDNWDNNLTENEFNDLIAQINLCDGIIFQGGGFCDNYEVIVAKYCYENNIPTLGICCGQHVMVRALGGTIKKIDKLENHKQNDKKYAHSIKLKLNSKIYQIINKSEIMVNSRHRKITSDHPKLVVTASSIEGYPEVVESPDKTFYMAVQFHPESLYKFDTSMNNIFKKFIDVCSEERKKCKQLIR